MQASLSVTLRNSTVYLFGICVAIVGALGLLAVVDLAWPAAAGLFVVGLAIVMLIHEHLGGPIQ